MKRFLLPIALLCFNCLQAQNIVPNGNLEDVNICDEYNCPCSPSGWFIVKRGLPGGYYHLYPDPAASGKQYFEIAAVNYGNTRQYWQTMLLCKLAPGEKYDVSVKIAAQHTGPNLHDIGFYFTSSFIYSRKDTLLQPAEYLSFLDAKVSKLRHGWFLLKKQFTASAEAGFLIVGNFSGDDNAAILKKRNTADRTIGLMIDDIVIKPKHAVCADYQKNKDSLYSITRRHSNAVKIVTARIKPDADTGSDTVAATPVTKPVKIDTLQLNNVLFEFDHYKLIKPDTLESFRHVLSNPAIKKIRVVGYTDDAGSVAYNATLSAKRAEEIARLIVAKFDISTDIIQAEGRGISKLYADKSLNRRVDIYVYY